MDVPELYARRLNAKEVLTPQRSGNFIFPVADGKVKIFGGERHLRTSTSTRERPERGEEQETLQGKSDELHSPTHLEEDSTRDDDELLDYHRRIHLSSSRRTKSQIVHAERRNISYSLPERLIHPWMLRWKNILKTTETWMEKENYLMHGQASQDSPYLNERPPDGFTWSKGRLTRKQNTFRPDDVWPVMWKFMSDAAKKKAKQRWAVEKPKLDNARELRGIYFHRTRR